MTTSVSLLDVSKAAGVSISTASRVICGKAAGNRIRPSTQNRVLAIARELGYQPNLMARDVVLGKPFRGEKPQKSGVVNQPQMTGIAAKRQKIDVLLSPVSSADTLNVIPCLIPVLAAAGYGLAIQTVPADPVAAAGQLPQMIDAEVVGILCCPSIYSVVSTFSGGKYPVLVLWQGAGQAIIAKSAGQGVPGGEPVKPAQMPPIPIMPVPVLAPKVTPKPVVIETPLPQTPAKPIPPVIAVTPETAIPPPIAVTPETAIPPPQAPPPVSIVEPITPVAEAPVPASPPEIEGPPVLEPEPVIPATATPPILPEPPAIAVTPEPPVPPPQEPPPVSIVEPITPVAETPVPAATPEIATPVLDPETGSLPVAPGS